MGQRDHADRVMARATAPGDVSRLAASWRRSVLRHGLDPAAAPPRDLRLDGAGLAQRRDALGPLMTVAAPRLDLLFTLVCPTGCGVALTDAQGIVLDRRVSAADSVAFDDWNLAPGADWSEAAQGTNGIGTCVAEGRAVTIHRDEHFLTGNTVMSCMDAPIHGPDGRLLAALDVSSARADQTAAMNGLIAAMVAQTARQIEQAWFRAAFPRARIIVAGDEAELIAVDGDELMLGATRAARRRLNLPREGALQPAPLVDLIGRPDAASGFERAERAAVKRALARAGGNVSAAARALGVGRATLYRRMVRLGLHGLGPDVGPPSAPPSSPPFSPQ